MSQYIPLIRRQATRLRLSGIGGNITSLLKEAEQNSPSYDEFTHNLFTYEIKGREAKQLLLKKKLARLPLNHDLEEYDFNFASGLCNTVEPVARAQLAGSMLQHHVEWTVRHRQNIHICRPLL